MIQNQQGRELKSKCTASLNGFTQGESTDFSIKKKGVKMIMNSDSNNDNNDTSNSSTNRNRNDAGQPPFLCQKQDVAWSKLGWPIAHTDSHQSMFIEMQTDID